MTYGGDYWRVMMKQDKDRSDKITEVMNDPIRVTKIIQAGINDALRKHKQAGNSVCVWRDNKVVWIPPEEIIIHE